MSQTERYLILKNRGKAQIKSLTMKCLKDPHNQNLIQKKHVDQGITCLGEDCWELNVLKISTAEKNTLTVLTASVYLKTSQVITNSTN